MNNITINQIGNNENCVWDWFNKCKSHLAKDDTQLIDFLFMTKNAFEGEHWGSHDHIKQGDYYRLVLGKSKQGNHMIAFTTQLGDDTLIDDLYIDTKSVCPLLGKSKSEIYAVAELVLIMAMQGHHQAHANDYMFSQFDV